MKLQEVNDNQQQVMLQQVRTQFMIQGHLALYNAACFSEDLENMKFQSEQIINLRQVELDLIFSMNRLIQVKIKNGWL